MSPAIRTIAPRYVRLSGEIADQAILDSLRAAFPQAAIGHAYASTEAGVGFDVNDGLAGFPAAFVGGIRDGVEMKVVDGSLRIRSPRTASRYVGGDGQPRSPTMTASSIPATWWSCAATAITSSAARAASSISAG